MPGAMLLIHKNAAKTTELSLNTTSRSLYALDDYRQRCLSEGSFLTDLRHTPIAAGSKPSYWI